MPLYEVTDDGLTLRPQAAFAALGMYERCYRCRMRDVRNRPPRLGRLPGVQTTTAVLAAGILALVALYVVLALTGQFTTLS